MRKIAYMFVGALAIGSMSRLLCESCEAPFAVIGGWYWSAKLSNLPEFQKDYQP